MPAAGVYEEFGFLFTAKDLASAVIKKTGSSVDAVAGGVQKSLDAIVTGVETTGVALAKGLKVAVKPFTSVFGDAVESSLSIATRGFVALTPTIDKAITTVTVTLSSFKKGVADSFKGATLAIKGFNIDAADALVAVVEKVQAFPSDVKKAFGLAGKALVGYAGEIRKNVSEATVAAFTVTKDAITDGVKAITDFGGKVKTTGKTVYEFVTKKEFSFEQFFDATVKGSKIAYDALKKGATDTAMAFKDGITGAVTNLSDTIKSAKKGVLSFWTEFKGRTGEAAVTFKEGIVNSTMTFFETVKKNAGAAGDKIKGLWQRFKEWDQAKLKAPGLGVPGGKGGKGGVPGFGGLGGGLDDAAKGFGKIRAAINSIGPALKLMFVGPLGLVMKVLEPIIEVISEDLEPLFDALKIAVKNAFAPFEAMMETIGQTLIPIVMKGLQPIVSLLTIVGAKVAMLFQGIAKGKGPSLEIGKLFSKLAPSFDKIVKALSGAAPKILHVIFKLVETLLPIIEQIVEILADQLANEIDVIGDVLKDAGPPLIEALGGLLKAMLPLVAAAIKLGSALLKYVFAPLLVKAVQGIALIVKHVITPFVNWFVPEVTRGIRSITRRVVDFYGNFSKYMTDLKVLFIDPIISWFTDDIPRYFDETVDSVVGFFKDVYSTVKGWIAKISDWVVSTISGMLDSVGLGNVSEKVGGAFDAVLKAVQSPIETMKSLINTGIIDPLNAVINYKFPLKIGSLKGLLGITDIQKLAEGGIAQRATTALIGEAGPEAVVPLKPEPIREIVAPVISELEMPMMKEVVDILSDIRRALGGELRVRVLDTGEGSASGLQNARASQGSESADLDAAIGVTGIVR